MKRFIPILLISFMLSGCSLIPRLTFNTPGTIPQAVDKSKAKEYCKGQTKFDEYGKIIYCSKSYYNYEENYEKKERNYTIKEKILNVFRNLSGLGFWGAVILVVLFPGILGSLLTFVFSASRRVARETINAIKKFRRESTPEVKESLDNYPREEQSKETKKYIAQVRASE